MWQFNRLSRYFTWRQWLVVAALLLPQIILLSDIQGGDPFRLSPQMLDKVDKKYGAASKQRLEAWQVLLSSDKKMDDLKKLKLVNDFFNQQIMFVSDAQNWGVEDYWATPVEMLAKGRGDCEDFAIAKYFSLLALGLAENKLRITYVQASGFGPNNLAHMVLSYYPRPAEMPLILDNLIPEIRQAALRPDLIPIYSFNGQGLWLAKDRSNGNARKNNIGFWSQLMSRRGHELDD
ncbi:transglutaminase-like cysteine peptidase [uncultured Deefgea sp.]|uniref:transglutaminase-like cysteine peptidase n=1 Tax=uncultured Deefgea sp. TaxID=1304914 RepID=UPI0026055F45|nr:transglutaminase-like cysteine peptidase [uncultured Deefgea sp.]